MRWCASRRTLPAAPEPWHPVPGARLVGGCFICFRRGTFRKGRGRGGCSGWRRADGDCCATTRGCWPRNTTSPAGARGATPHRRSATWRSSRRRACSDPAPRSDPAAALEEHVERQGDREHEPEGERVAELPLELGNVLEVHAVDRADHGRGE